MPSRARTRAGVAAVVVSSALALAGCTSESTAPLYEGPPGQQKQAARLAAGVKIIKQTILAGLEAETSRFDEVSVTDGVTTRFTGRQRTGSTFAGSALSGVIKTGGESRDIVVVDALVYLDFGAATGGKFFVLDPSEPGIGKRSFGYIAKDFEKKAELIVPRAMVDFRTMGPATVEGVDTTHYRVLANSAKLRPIMDFELKRGEAPKVVSFDIWIDDDLQTRKLSWQVAGNSETETASAYGKPVDIDAPPPARITSVSPFADPATAA